MPEKTDAFRRNVVKQVRLLGITYGELATRAGLSREWLSKMLHGRSNPTLPVCEQIATALDTSLEALVADTARPSVSGELDPQHFAEQNTG